MRNYKSLRIETACTNLITCAQFGDAKIAESTVVKIERGTSRNNHNAHAALVGKNVEEEALAARGKGLSSWELLGCDNWGETRVILGKNAASCALQLALIWTHAGDGGSHLLGGEQHGKQGPRQCRRRCQPRRTFR